MSSVTSDDAGAVLSQAGEAGGLGACLRELVQRTFGERVLQIEGGAGPLFSLDYDERLFRHNYAHPVLVSAAQGAGPKVAAALATGRHDAVGMDLVAQCANEVLTVGAEPLFFLDCVAMGEPDPQVVQQFVGGVAAGCKQAGCALLGGRTVQAPGRHGKGGYDAAGFVVGVCESRRLVTGRKIRAGDVLVGLPSDGLHAGGYAVAQRVLLDQAGMHWRDALSRFGIERTVGEELVRPARMYVRAVRAVLRHYTIKQVVAGISPVKDGGLCGAIMRLLPADCAAEVDSKSWRPLPIFDAVQQLGRIPADRMHHIFNMGIGLVLMVAPFYAESVVAQLRREGEEPLVIGRVVEGPRQVTVS
jgi:phosphoribosylformylglycinamidine cyclo-ligase